MSEILESKEFIIYELLKENESLQERLKSNKQKIKELLQDDFKAEAEKIKDLDIFEEAEKEKENKEVSA